jgi:hypothetical protein
MDDQASESTRRQAFPIQDVPTRWNSTFAMLKRALHLQKPIQMFALNYRKELGIEPLTDSSWLQFEYLVDFLEPFQDATLESSGDTYVTVSSQLPLYNQLLDQLDESQVIKRSALTFRVFFSPMRPLRL